jgi:hypothetical protein
LLSRADFLEDAGARSGRIRGNYMDYGKVFSQDDVDLMCSKLNLTDVIKYSKNIFDVDISILAMGPSINIDMMAVWKANFS